MQRLEVSGALRPLYGSLGVKGLRMSYHRLHAAGWGFPPFSSAPASEKSEDPLTCQPLIWEHT